VTECSCGFSSANWCEWSKILISFFRFLGIIVLRSITASCKMCVASHQLATNSPQSYQMQSTLYIEFKLHKCNFILIPSFSLLLTFCSPSLKVQNVIPLEDYAWQFWKRFPSPCRQNNDSMLVQNPFLVKGVCSYNGSLRAAFQL